MRLVLIAAVTAVFAANAAFAQEDSPVLNESPSDAL